MVTGPGGAGCGGGITGQVSASTPSRTGKVFPLGGKSNLFEAAETVGRARADILHTTQLGDSRALMLPSVTLFPSSVVQARAQALYRVEPKVSILSGLRILFISSNSSLVSSFKSRHF